MTEGGAGPDILCMDHYPFFEYPAGSNLTSSVAGYRANLQVLRASSLRTGIPFWCANIPKSCVHELSNANIG